MNDHYRPDNPSDSVELLLATASGPEPPYDPVLSDFLQQQYVEVKKRCRQGGLLKATSFGRKVPWIWRLTLRTKSRARSRPGGRVESHEHHDFALRFMSDYLRRADKFEILRLIEPCDPLPFHPNIADGCAAPFGMVCVEIYPGESLVDICESLHDIIRWRLRQYDERDALNPAACAWGRAHVDRPIDDRPLFGRPLKIQLERLD